MRTADPAMTQCLETLLLSLHKRDFAGALRWGRMTSMVDIEWLPEAPTNPDPVLVEALVLYTLATRCLNHEELEKIFGRPFLGIDSGAFGETAREILFQRWTACGLKLGLLPRGHTRMVNFPRGGLPEDMIFIREKEKVVASFKDGEKGLLTLVYGPSGPDLSGEALAARLRAVKAAISRLNVQIDLDGTFGDGI